PCLGAADDLAVRRAACRGPRRHAGPLRRRRTHAGQAGERARRAAADDRVLPRASASPGGVRSGTGVCNSPRRGLNKTRHRRRRIARGRRMEAGRRCFTTLAFALCALSLAGCANLGAVREFAASSARMTDYRDATEHYLDSADRQLTELPATARFEGTREQLQALKQVTARDKKTLLGLHATTTGYMRALARLAGADAYSVSTEIGQVARAIETSDALGIDEDHVDAYANIARRVSDWVLAARQAWDVRHLVTENGADMDKLLEAMQRATEAY